MHKGDWLASLDLNDAFFHVPVLARHQKYLRFSFQKRQFQFKALPFIISTAPWVFTKILAPVIGLLHHKGVQIFPYLDDCLITARTHSHAVGSSSQSYSRHTKPSRLYHKHQKVTPLTSSEALLSVCRVRHYPDDIIPSQESSSGIEASRSGLYEPERNQNSLSVPLVLRNNSLSSVDDSIWQTEDETHLNILQHSLEGIHSFSGVSNSHFTISVAPHSLVDRSFQSDPGVTVEQTQTNQSSHYRCLSFRLGRLSLIQKGSRSMEDLSSTSSHQCSRVNCGDQQNESIFTPVTRSVSLDSHRQYFGAPLYQQNGRHSISTTVHFDMGSDPLPLVHLSPDTSPGCSYSRERHYSRRYAVQEDCPLPRVGSSRSYYSRIISSLGHTPNRSLRHSGQQETSLVVLATLSSPGRYDGCVQSGLDRSVSLCFSSTSNDQGSSDQSGEGTNLNDSNSSQMGQEGLVPNSPGPIGGLSCETPCRQRLSSSTGRTAITSQPSRIATSGLDDQRNKLLASGLSGETTETLLTARSRRTHQCYQSGWNHFVRWCESKDVDPDTTTLTLILNYLQYCFSKLDYVLMLSRLFIGGMVIKGHYEQNLPSKSFLKGHLFITLQLKILSLHGIDQLCWMH